MTSKGAYDTSKSYRKLIFRHNKYSMDIVS